MDQSLLNEILEYLGLDIIIDREHFRSGQRAVFFGKSTLDEVELAVKYCIYTESKVARIQREINILVGLSSEYFPKVHKHMYVTSEMIAEIIDGLDVKTQADQISLLQTSNIRPFFISIESFIPNISWEEAVSGPNKIRILIDLLYHCFEALTLLWSAKIVHRDLKPPNILIRHDGKPVIIDLGIAKSLKEGTRNLTNPLIPSPCTPSYAAPEQLIPDSEVNYKADQFAMGAIAFEMLTGKFPYGDYSEIDLDGLITNFQNGKLLDIRELNPEVKPELASFINKLLSVQPYRRFRHAEAILEELSQVRSLYQ